MSESEIARQIAAGYRATARSGASPEGEAIERIHVDEIASKIATFYEKVRNVIDYREEHLLRKGAIGRILRRRLFLKDFDANFAEPLIKELIRGGHLPNDTLPVSHIAAVAEVIQNLSFLLQHGNFQNQREREVVSDWLVDVFVPAIEQELFLPPPERPLAKAMYDAIRPNIIIRNAELAPREIDVQLFLAIERALFRPDRDQLHYALLKFAYPEWGKLPEEQLAKVAQDLFASKVYLDNLLAHPAGPYFLRLVSREKIIFQLLGDLVATGAPLNEDDLAESLLPLYRRRYYREASRRNRLAFLSIVSFLVSKVLVALAIEIPIDHRLGHAVSPVTMAINILFPPLLMFLIVLFIRLPSRNNFHLLVRGVKEIISPGEKPREYVVAVPKHRNSTVELLIRLAYLATLAVTLYYLVKLLLWLNFSTLSIAIFVLFTSMVIATGVKVANRSKELSIEKERATIRSFILDLVIVPYLTIGRATISGLSRFNIIVLIFNFLIELPFQLFVEFLENFRTFIQTKKEEIR